MAERPLIGITMGDPAGVGPEIIVKALADESLYRTCRPVVLGDPEVIASNLQMVSQELSVNIIKNTSQAPGDFGDIDLVPISHLDAVSNRPGHPTLAGGSAMVEYIFKAVELTKSGLLHAMVTCPISKVLMHQAGYAYDGHTELIAHLTDSDEYVMMLAGQRLRVSLVTIHCALKEVPLRLNKDMICKTIDITATALIKDFGISHPCIAVAALNPHAGESGLFGSEENEIILPAIKRSEKPEISITGPHPPDTLFHQAATGRYDAVIAMYHDQGLIPLKLLHFSDAVNVTLGIPIIRTSVDHGTAYDIAGTGRADPSSLKAAVKMAATMSANRGTKNNDD